MEKKEKEKKRIGFHDDDHDDMDYTSQTIRID